MDYTYICPAACRHCFDMQAFRSGRRTAADPSDNDNGTADMPQTGLQCGLHRSMPHNGKHSRIPSR